MINVVRTRLRCWRSFGVGVLGVIGALLYVTGENQPWLGAAVLVFSLVALVWIISRFDPCITEGVSHPDPGPSNVPPEQPAPIWLLLPAILATTVAAVTTLLAGKERVDGNVGVPWLLGVGLFALASWWPGSERWLTSARERRQSITWPKFHVWALWGGMFAVAALPRLLRLDHFPTVIDGDEGMYMLSAVEARTGTMVNPFATGWFGVPNLYPAIQGWLTSVVGTDVAGHRMLGAVVGTIGILATWRLGTHVIGPWPAIVGAVIMATLPFHLFFSRSALNHISDPTTLILALLFLWLGLGTRQRSGAFLSGVMVGLGWYGYWGARIFPVIIAILLGFVAIDRREGQKEAVRLGSWAATGFLAISMPLLMSFVLNPTEFRSRVTIVSFLTLDRWRIEPGTMIRLFLDNLRETLLFPFVSYDDLFFRHQAPFLGWPIAIAIVIGLATWIAGVVRDHAFQVGAWLFVPWIVLTLGVAMTTPIQSQRIVAMIPFWCLAAGSGFVALVRWLTLIGSPAPLVTRRILTAVALVALAATHLTWMASEDRQFSTYGDFRTTTAWDIGWRLANANPDRAEGPQIFFAGPPFMFAGGWGNLRVLAPDAAVTDVTEPLVSAADVPPLPAGSMLILVPERSGEGCVIALAHLEATVAEVRARDGTLLYLAFFHEPLAGWSTATTPGETTFKTVTTSPCSQTTSSHQD